jgi:hypothetical protein
MVFKKAPFGRPFRPSRRQKPSTPNSGERPFCDPAFHETTVILVPLGPSVLKNIIFSMMIGYFSVFSAFRCAMFYMSFLSHLLINAQPLSPPIFEKIAPYFKNNVFSYFGCLRLRFLYLFIFVLIFGCPFPPPPGPDWSHLWSILVPCCTRATRPRNTTGNHNLGPAECA